MEWIGDSTIIAKFLKRYQWAILIVAIGLLMIILPDGEKNVQESIPSQEEPIQESNALQNQLEQLLSQLDGAGKVRVLLTESIGQQFIYQTDQNKNITNESEDHRSDTVIISATDRSETGLLKRIDPPQYLGAIVLCQGANNASVRLAIVDAVGTATGLRSDKISVWKMK